MRGFWKPLEEAGTWGKWLCKLIGHKFKPAGKKTRVNPYYIPAKVCARCGERW